MVKSIWYVEAACSGQYPSNIIQHKILPIVWRRTELTGIYAILGLGKPLGSVCNITVTLGSPIIMDNLDGLFYGFYPIEKNQWLPSGKLT